MVPGLESLPEGVTKIGPVNIPSMPSELESVNAASGKSTTVGGKRWSPSAMALTGVKTDITATIAASLTV